MSEEVLGLICSPNSFLLPPSRSVTELFRNYYFVYGLVQLGNNLFANCSLIFLLKTIGFDIKNIVVLLASIGQVFIACAFGQQLQDEVCNWQSTG